MRLHLIFSVYVCNETTAYFHASLSFHDSESDWEPDVVACSSNTVDNQLQTVAELQTTVTPGGIHFLTNVCSCFCGFALFISKQSVFISSLASPELSPKEDGKSDEESGGKHEKVRFTFSCCAAVIDGILIHLYYLGLKNDNMLSANENPDLQWSEGRSI